MATKTFVQALWLRNFGHYMPKRTKIWSNSALIRKFETGKLKKRKGKKKASGVRKYQDKKGKTRVAGSALLKKSQQLVSILEHACMSLQSYLSCMTYIYQLRRYPARFAREVVETIPLFRNGPEMHLPAEAS